MDRLIPHCGFKVLAGVVMAVAPMLAQGQSIDQLRTRSGELSDSDRQIVRKYVFSKLQAIIEAKDVSTAIKGRRELLRPLQSDSVTPSPFFRNAFTDAMVEFLSRHKLDQLPGTIRLQVMLSLASVRDIALSRYLLEHAGETDVAIRYWAVKGLLLMHDQIINSPLPSRRAALREMLQDRLSQENCPVVLEMLYALCRMPNDLQTVAVLLDAVKRRCKAYQSWKVRTAAADRALLRVLAALAKSVKDEKLAHRCRQAFVDVYAAIVYRYLWGSGFRVGSSAEPVLSKHEQSQLKAIIWEAQEMLNEVAPPASPGYGFRDALQKNDKLDLLESLVKGLGTPETPESMQPLRRCKLDPPPKVPPPKIPASPASKAGRG